jgi:indolepyruvate ferredoxin oxidoreductase
MDERFLKEEGIEVYTGSELVVKGALEAAVALITGYPGSPISDVFDVAHANRELLKQHGILAEMANNEALSVARLNGSRMAGVRAMAVMKSVGLHVAADGLALGNLSEPHNEGGSIVVVGDDPWIDSTQINNDSRFLSRHLHMPVLEPGTFQEVKDWVGVAFELSSTANLYITYLLTTNQADGGGTVWTHPNRYPAVNTYAPITLDSSRFNLDTTVLLPPRTWTREASLPARFETLKGEARARGLNRILYTQPGRFPLGFVASGLTYCYLEHALADMGLAGRIPLLKLGLTYPVDAEMVLQFAQQVGAIFVVEEKRGFVEGQILEILHDARQSGALAREIPLWGKKFPGGREGIPEVRGLNPSVIAERLIPMLLEALQNVAGVDLARLRAELAMLEATRQVSVALPPRTPTFCPGCPHRDSSSVLLQVKKDFMDPAYMKRTHQSPPVDLVFHGETGCFTMLMFEPNKPLMHNYSGMGLGGGTGAGLDPFITNKQVVFLGDSTFFHSGMLAISDSIKSQQDITYIILDNKTTAMTGHQPTPGTDLNLLGEPTFAQNIEKILEGMSHGSGIPVVRTDPNYRDSYRQLLEDTILQDGVKVIIADKECGITYHRRVKKEKKALLRWQGYLPEERHINVTPEVCEFCLECTKTTGCPGLTIEETLYGPKIVADLTHCVSDGACAKMKVCPSFEEVTVRRRAPARSAVIRPVTEGLPFASLPEFESVWSIYTAGVGGMGTGLMSAILVRAAQRQGYRVLFSDKKGLAIRNGGVYAHVVISKDGGILSPLIPYGKADVLLGVDLLEAARSLDPKNNLRVVHPARTRAVVNTALNPTIRMLMGEDALPGPAMGEVIHQHVQPGHYFGCDFSAISDHYFDSKLYTNLVLLGAAWQQGYLPLALENMESAIVDSVPRDDRKVNLEAFHIGRAVVAEPHSLHLPEFATSYDSLVQEKARYLRELYGRRTAEEYRRLMDETVFHLGLDARTHTHLAQRVYDLICYEDLAAARRYTDLVLATAQKDRASWQHQATQAVLRQAFKVMAIKDEVYVAHLLTSPEKRQRDLARYRIDEANGDRLVYRHFTRPEFKVFGRTLRWDMDSRNWQLRLLRHLKFLRRLLPAWHREEKEFRDWYLQLAGRFQAEDEASYALWVKILNCPERVRGYREIRRPCMETARLEVVQCLQKLREHASARQVLPPFSLPRSRR